MREIKFRAWHKKEKRFIGFYGYGLHMWENGQIYAGGMNVTDRIELIQYTGLKDKNCVEVYEGDITKGVAADGQIISNGVIYFRGCDYVVDFKEGAAQGFYYLHHILCDTLEVIGNIYENPDLLGGVE